MNDQHKKKAIAEFVDENGKAEEIQKLLKKLGAESAVILMHTKEGASLLGFASSEQGGAKVEEAIKALQKVMYEYQPYIALKKENGEISELDID